MIERLFRFSYMHRIAFALASVLAIVYATTMNRTVSFIDAGELATAAVTLSIAHPTGYPLFVLLGRIASAVPLGFPVILKLNVFALILVSAAMGIFFEASVLLIVLSAGHRRSKKLAADSPAILLGAAVGTLVLGLSTTVWAQSTSIEVYALHLLLLMAVLYSFVNGVQKTEENEEGTISRWFLLFMFLLGMSFANHMTTILLAPAFLYFYWARAGANKRSILVLVKSAPFFLLGISIYLFLPLRSSMHPVLDWGHPAGWERFLWHVSGKQYRSWIFSGFESAERQLAYFFGNIPNEFNWLAIALLVPGLWALMTRKRPWLAFVFLLFAGCLAYSVNYDIHDIDSYFLLAYVAMGIIMVFGSYLLIGRSWAWGSRRRFIVAGILLIPALQFMNNRTAVDESDNTLVRDYTKNILQGVDSNAVILTYQWDYFVSASYYYQRILGWRPDVVVIDKELLRRSWYFLQLQRNYPWLLERSRGPVETFLAELGKFEHDLPYDGAVIEAAFNGMINDILRKAFESRPVYLGAEIEPQFAPGFLRIPEGLLLRLSDPAHPVNERNVPVEFRSVRTESKMSKGLILQYLQMFTLHAYWAKNKGNWAESNRWLDRAMDVDPSYGPANRLRREILESGPGQ